MGTENGEKRKKSKLTKGHCFLSSFSLQEELLKGYKDLCAKVIEPKLNVYFKEMPKMPFE